MVGTRNMLAVRRQGIADLEPWSLSIAVECQELIEHILDVRLAIDEGVGQLRRSVGAVGER
jgi:hypothetical protein